jgi:GNAT superfamily N-acetyltransferase
VSDAPLRRAVVANHRSIFRRNALAAGGRIERFGSVQLTYSERGGAIVFPRSARGLDPVVERIRELRLRDVGCWSRQPNPRLGAFMVSRGFQWGWQPHWMALDLAGLTDERSTLRVIDRPSPYPGSLPYGEPGPDPPAVLHLAVCTDGRPVGHVVVNPWRGIAGIYSMGVAEAARRRGIGRALVIAACRRARELGCTHAVLNSTDRGESVYRAVGFESLGRGQTWWLAHGPAPAPRSAAIALAIGHGDGAALAALDPSAAELAAGIAGDTGPLRLAVLTGHGDLVEWMLSRAPQLVAERFAPSGGTLLHLAVEQGDAGMIAAALAHGADPAAVDRSFGSTPRGWAEYLRRDDLAALLPNSTD